MLCLRGFIRELQKTQEIVEVHEEVDPHLEIAEIHRRVAAADGPALFFRRVRGSSFPVVTNLFGSKKRVNSAFHNRPEETLTELVRFFQENMPPTLSKVWQHRSLFKKILNVGLKKERSSGVLECSMDTPNLNRLPLLTSWPLDGGAFITLPLVYTEPVGGGPHNLGMYRIQRYNEKQAGLHWQIAKGGGFHFHEAELQNKSLPVNILLGGPPALILSAITPLPENVPELLLCSFLQGKKLSTVKAKESVYPLVKHCEFALIGDAKPHERRLEGPFGDHYGYYSLEHDFPVFNCKKIYHRKDAIYPATVVGKPRQEDFYIGNYLQELLSPLFPLVMPAVKSLWSYAETGFHALSAIVVNERYERECMTSAFRVLGEGQLSLTKFLLVTNQQVDVKDIKALLKIVLERFQPEKDLFIFSNLSLDTLDYTGPSFNKGSRGVILGVGDKVRDLQDEFQGRLPSMIKRAKAFCPGCLVVEAGFGKEMNMQEIASYPSFAKWPLLILVDSLEKTLRSTASFLWTTFTRFEPAADIYSSKCHIYRNHLCHGAPILIDARMKPKYPQEVLVDDATSSLVTKRWNNYFPGGMPMGDSLSAHVS
ncbi:MAG: UbiD family decarboxylase [Chlamydiales bacterium]|nr:UbiD family decarboxylase [Chlamydiales bacterium]